MSHTFPTDRRGRRSHWRTVATSGIPDATVARLPVYLRALNQLAEQQIDTISSGALAEAAGVNSAQLRKDLSYLGSYGTRGSATTCSTCGSRSAAPSAPLTTGR